MESVKTLDLAAAAMRKGFPRQSKHQEAFIVMAVDVGMVPIGKPWIAALGTATGVGIHPRDVFREAVKRNAVSIFIAHNHPSGWAGWSDEDKRLTDRIEEAGRILGIAMQDHLLFAGETIVSYRGAS